MIYQIALAVVLSTLFLASVTLAADAPPADSTTILKWKDGKAGAFYMAFDDSCPTHLTNVIPELQKRKIVGTFYPIAGNANFNGNPKWQEAARSPYVVLANHTLTHKDFPTVEKFESEIAEARKILVELTPDANPNRLISFGKPGGVKYGITDDQIKESLGKHNLLNRAPFLGAVLHIKTVEDMQKLVDATIEKKELGHLDFHGVGGDWLVTPVDYFQAVLEKLDATRDQLWLSDAVSVMKYAAQRKTARVSVVESTPTSIRLKLSTQLDATLYDQPMTLTTQVPAAWKQATIAQGKAKSTVAVVDGAVTYDAVPDGTEVVLTPGE